MADSLQALPMYYWFAFGMISMTAVWIAWHRKPVPQEISQRAD
jgi:hypothetical protein